MKMEAEIGVMPPPQAKDIQLPPEAGKGNEWILA